MTVRAAWARVAGDGPLGTFAVAHVLAGAGDTFVAVALAGSLFFNVSPKASRDQVLLYLAITMVPFAVLAPLIGPAVDRFRGAYRSLASVTYLLRAAAAVGLAFTLHELSFYVLALVLLVASKASGVVRQALVPRLVDDTSHLVAANARLARVGTIVGAVAGGLALLSVRFMGGPGRLAVAASLFLAAAVIVWWLPAALATPPSVRSVEYVELHTPSVVISSAGLMALRAGVGYFTFMLAFALRRRSEPAWVYGAAIVGYAVGAFIGHVVAPVLRRRVNEETLMAAALVAAAAMCTLGVLGVNRSSLAALALGLGVSESVGRQAFDSLLQRAAPDALRGQAFARYETRFQLSWVLGALVATAVVLPVSFAMAVLAALFVPAGVMYVRGARDSLRFEPPPSEGMVVPALSHLAAAVAWRQAGHVRHAVVEAAAAVDLARAAGAPAPSPADTARLDALRLAAVSGEEPVSEHDVDDALRIARSVLEVSQPPVPPTSPSSPR